MIYTTGDSHAQWTFHDIPGVKVHSISMLTMQRIGYMEDDLIPGIVAEMPLTSADVLILASGEIDCRAHIKPRLDHRKISLEDLVGGWVERYLERAITLDTKGARVVICGVPPPVPEGEIIYGGVVLPVEGSNAERVNYTKTCNRLLAEGCAKRGLAFIDVYDVYADERGLLRPELSDGSVHIAKTEGVRAEMRRLGLIE